MLKRDPLKNYVVVDAHNHYIPREAAERASASSGVVNFGARSSSSPNAAYLKLLDIEGNLRHMEDCGIDMCLLGLSNWIAAGRDVCRAINKSYAKLARDYPGKFIPLAHVPYHDGPPALGELERAVTELGLQGVTVVTSIDGLTLDSESLFPFYETVSELAIPIVVHPSVKIPIWGGSNYNLSSSVSREYEIAKSVVEVLQGVLPRFPDLKFLFAHFGGGISALKGRVISWFSLTPDDVPADHRDMPRSLREAKEFNLMKTFDKYFNKMYFDMAGFAGHMPAVKAALMTMNHDRICFGTDYPYEFMHPQDCKAYIAAIKMLDIPRDEKRALLGENLLRLFRPA